MQHEREQEMKFYHESATENRQSILERGLALSITRTDGTEEELSITGGIFLFTKLRGRERSEFLDIWEVDVTELTVIEDDTDVPFEPGDTWWVVYCHPIGPERLMLLESMSGNLSLVGQSD